MGTREKVSNYIVDLLIILGAFIIIYNPPLINFNSMHIVGGLSIFYVLINKIRDNRLIINKNIGYLLFAFFIIFFYLFINVVLVHGYSISESIYPIYFILDVIPFGYAVAINLNKRHLTANYAFNLLVIMALIQSIIAILCFFIKDVQIFFFNRFISYGYGDAETLKELLGYRMRGFASELTFSMPIAQTIISLMCIYSARQVNKLIRWIEAVVILISAVINARISLVVFFLGYIVIIIKSSLKKKILYLIIFAVAIIMFFLVGMPMLRKYAYPTYYWLYEWISDMTKFMRGDMSGYYFSYATNPANHPIPKTFIGIIFGEGFRTMGALSTHGVASDMGYYNDLFLGGIIYMLMIYCGTAHLCVQLIKDKRNLVRYVGIVSLIVLFVVNIKASIFNMNSMLNLFILMYVVTRMLHYQDDIEGNNNDKGSNEYK